jgi:hypothetical protein
MSPPAERAAVVLSDSLRHLRSEAPQSYQALCAALRDMAVACRVDNDRFTLHSDGRETWLGEPRAPTPPQVEASVQAVLDVIDGRRQLVDTLLDGAVAVRARLEDAIRLDDALRTYVHGAALAPSCARLRARLAAASAGQQGGNDEPGRSPEPPATPTTRK